MRSKWIVPLLAMGGLLVAIVAFAADAAKKTPPPDVRKNVVRIVEVGDDGAAAEFGWEGDDGRGLFALGGDDLGDDGERRIVSRRGAGMRGGMGRGMGMGRGRGMHRGMGQGSGMGMGMGRGFAALDLTDAQRDRMADLHERQQRKAIQARAELQIARMDLQKLMKADSPSATSINSQIDRLARMRADMQKSRVATLLETRALLTPEQRKQLREAKPGAPGQGRQQRLRLHQPPTGGQPKAD
jgi:Spy/CpxP family protein refolding chaperone